MNLKNNRLALETLLWGLGVLDQEGIRIDFDNEFIVNASKSHQ